MAYNKLAVVLGNCLFPDHSFLNPDKNTLFFMAEDEGLCTHYQYHKHKLMLYLSSMRSHADEIRKKHDLAYYTLTKDNSSMSFEDKLEACLKENLEIEQVSMYVIEDKFFDKRMRDFFQKKELKFTTVASPGFLTTYDDFGDYLQRSKKPFMQYFYIEQRKKFNLLLEEDEKPVGGKWSYDDQNRKKLPKDIHVPKQPQSSWTAHTEEVATLINEHFSGHPGSTENFNWATTRRQALHRLQDFLESRFEQFGPYEDAIDSERNFLFHSVLSPYMNLGLITADEVLDQALAYAEKNDVHLPSVEGFVRQIAGWREFMRGMYQHYDLEGNHFGHQRKLADCWYDGSTGVPPLDDSIKRAVRDGYTHHIERLMVLGNIMLLSEIHPDEAYRWFMEMFVDSSDWVMVPNVYGMSQFADGGTFATKPYIGGANYISKMSDYRKKGDWADEIDGLYWRFIDKNRKLFGSNPRMSMMTSMFDKMKSDKKDRLMKAAQNFIKRTSHAS